MQSSRDRSVPPPNWMDDLSWSLGWVSHGKCTSACDAHCVGIKLLKARHDVTKLDLTIPLLSF